MAIGAAATFLRVNCDSQSISAGYTFSQGPLIRSWYQLPVGMRRKDRAVLLARACVILRANDVLWMDSLVWDRVASL